uniref:Uncharacterized protein n=1 Tax=Cacopsylla melanoneura TaxID=428564 RepID=A0A8D9B8F2_9HEMI
MKPVVTPGKMKPVVSPDVMIMFSDEMNMFSDEMSMFTDELFSVVRISSNVREGLCIPGVIKHKLHPTTQNWFNQETSSSDDISVELSHWVKRTHRHNCGGENAETGSLGC